jgi:hypothetical protein
MKNTRNTLLAIGFVLFLLGMVKATIIGYYPSEEPLVFGMLISSVVCLYIGSKIKPAAKR